MLPIINLPIFSGDVFSMGFIHIKWYSLAYIFGLIFAWQLLKFFNKKYNLNIYSEKNKSKFCDDFFVYGVSGIVLGGRLAYVLFYNFSYFIYRPLEIFALWHGGMSFHGGFVGALLASLLLCKKYNIKYLKFTDILSCVAPIGLFLGRIANFINLELYGKPTNGNWGFIFPTTGDNIPRHPSQLYEAFLEGIVIFILMLLISKKYKFKTLGLNSSLFLIFYGMFRFIIEFFREPDAQLGYIFGFLTMGQLLSFPLIFGGIYLLLKIKKQYDKFI